MIIAGGNTRDLATANESREGEYRNKRRTENHLSAGEKRPSSLRALYSEQLFPGLATWGDSKA